MGITGQEDFQVCPQGKGGNGNSRGGIKTGGMRRRWRSARGGRKRKKTKERTYDLGG